MASLFSSTNNTRRLIENSSRFIRSDVPIVLKSNEIQWLKDQNVFTIIDLRDESEQKIKPCPLKIDPSFDYFSMPVTGGNDIPEKPQYVASSYIAMCDDKMEKIIDKIVRSKSNVLFFCNAGKDRTGVVSAILLYLLGYDDEYIINDYMKSADNLKEMLLNYAKANISVDIEVITPHAEYIREFIEWYKTRGYKKHAGI
ncbi:MAG: tyrosine-protein phosphatase [Ruminococcus sp.]|nr:tyrosine-protein phosphatase [Ruminococcus sp.]